MRIGGLGYQLKFSPVEVAGKSMVQWELKRWANVLGKGIETTEKKAEAKALAVYSESNIKAARGVEAKQPFRNTLSRMTKKRSYLTLAVLSAVMRGNRRETILREAEANERFIWEKEDPKFREPLREHHRLLPHREAAEQLLNALQGLEWTDENDRQIKNKVHAYVKKMFGPSYVAEKAE